MDPHQMAAKLSRAMQDVTRKTAQVDQLVTEVKDLDVTNRRLVDSNKQLQRRNEDLEAALRERTTEKQSLEATVKTQQQRLQKLLDSQADLALSRTHGGSANAQTTARAPSTSTAFHHSSALRSTTPSPDRHHSAEQQEQHQQMIQEAAAKRAEDQQTIENLRKKIADLEEARQAANAANEALEKSSRLLSEENQNHRRTNADQRREFARERLTFKDELRKHEEKEKALEAVIANLKVHHTQLAKEAKEMEDIESKAREGVKVEWTALTLENARLEKRVVELTAEDEVRAEQMRKLEDLLQHQRQSFEESLDLLRRELQGVHDENENLMIDVRRTVTERDALRKQLLTSNAALKQQAEATESVSSARRLREAMMSAVEPEPAIPSARNQHSPLRRAVSVPTQGQQNNLRSPSHTATEELSVAPPPPPPAVTQDDLNDLHNDVEALRVQLRDAETGRLEALEEINRLKASTALVEQRAQENALLREEIDQRKHALLHEANEDAHRYKRMIEELTTEVERLSGELNKVSQQQQQDRDEGEESTALERLATTNDVAAPQQQPMAVVNNNNNNNNFDDSEVVFDGEIPAYLEDLEVAVGELLIMAGKILHSVQHPTIDGGGPSSSSSSSVQYPVVPCTRFTHPRLNIIEQEMGGLKHVLKALRAELHQRNKRSLMQQQQQHHLFQPERSNSTDVVFVAASHHHHHHHSRHLEGDDNDDNNSQHHHHQSSQQQHYYSSSRSKKQDPTASGGEAEGRSSVSRSHNRDQTAAAAPLHHHRDDDDDEMDLRQLVRDSESLLESAQGRVAVQGARLNSYRSHIEDLRRQPLSPF